MQHGFLVQPGNDAPTRFGVLALLVANGLILLAVLFFGWGVGNILLVYWAETGIIGFWCLATLIRQQGLPVIPVALFLTVHFGIFMFVHFMFLAGITSAIRTDGLTGMDFNPLRTLAMIPLGGVVVLFVARGMEAVLGWRRSEPNKEFELRSSRRSDDLKQMVPAYARIFVMQFTIIFGAGLVFVLGQGTWLLVLMIVVKTGVDLMFSGVELKTRQRSSEQSTT